MSNIEETHKNNFKIIKKYNLKKGTIFIHLKTNTKHIIKVLHPLYGWCVVKALSPEGVGIQFNQDFSNINEFKIKEVK